jgi:hypothetical protein
MTKIDTSILSIRQQMVSMRYYEELRKTIEDKLSCALDVAIKCRNKVNFSINSDGTLIISAYQSFRGELDRIDLFTNIKVAPELLEDQTQLEGFFKKIYEDDKNKKAEKEAAEHKRELEEQEEFDKQEYERLKQKFNSDKS